MIAPSRAPVSREERGQQWGNQVGHAKEDDQQLPLSIVAALRPSCSCCCSSWVSQGKQVTTQASSILPPGLLPDANTSLDAGMAHTVFTDPEWPLKEASRSAWPARIANQAQMSCGMAG